ncbi:c-type cytochrome [Burkholderia sp. Ac-20353]|uniref:c-type cytochrome n=1 Tax=Burkholderia sp. Ac-20353 TaxID=2703894 RepID=UPI00197B69BF|nr:c-type cytochrome [Burkholderia sp. Ac-20353]MBN3787681.1 c-type cytochrome [Burkholderia sp. Ac-20353]
MKKQVPLQRLAAVVAAAAIFSAISPVYAAGEASQPMTNGKHEFENKCAMCHAVEPSKGTIVGPNLFGVYGRKVGKFPGFSYSSTLRSSSATWDAATLDAFLKSPQTAMPGTAMPFSGIKGDPDRAALIDYLKSLH